MPRIIITQGAALSLERCRFFLFENNPKASMRASQAIEHLIVLLETQPQIGRPFDDLPKLQELIIPFGDSGYVALYRHDIKADLVFVLALRHQKETRF